jgi:hypothetical protein
MDKYPELEQRVTQIEKRNKEVELNKSWEGSWTRKALIALFTYLSIALYFQYILEIDPWLNAIVPTVGFLLSTLSLPYFKKMWLKFKS